MKTTELKKLHCLKCKEEVLGQINPSKVNDMYYCKNRECDRYGLLAVIFSSKY